MGFIVRDTTDDECGIELRRESAIIRGKGKVWMYEAEDRWSLEVAYEDMPKIVEALETAIARDQES